MTDRYIIYDPEVGWLEADSPAEFSNVVDHYCDQAGEGWHADVECLALCRLVPVVTVRLVRIASAEDATEAGERCRAAGWDYLLKLVEDQHEDPTLAACGHPAACLRDGACALCAAIDDARLHMEERDALRAHVERLHRLLDHVCNRLDVTDLPTAVRLVEEVGAALAATPADSLAYVRAEAIRSVAQEIREQDDYTVGETLSRAEASRVAGWLGARAGAIERGEP